MNTLFETAFKNGVKKHSAVKKQAEAKVLKIIEHPIELGEPLKGNWRGFYSCPVKRSFLIIYLYCDVCRKKGDDVVVQCDDCAECSDDTLKFVLFDTHDNAYAARP